MDIDYTRLLDTINIDILLTLVITTILSFATEGTFEIFKHGYRKLFRSGLLGKMDERLDALEKDRAFYLNRASKCPDDIELQEFYHGLAKDSLVQIEHMMHQNIKISWIHVVVPVVIATTLVVFLRPWTIFYWLPFQPNSYAVSVAITAVLCTRAAGTAHDGGSKFLQFLDSIINRVSPRF